MIKTAFLWILYLSPVFLIAGTGKAQCHSIDDVVKKTVEALNKRDVALFMTLTNYDTLLYVMQKTAEKDSSAKHALELFGKRKEFILKSYESEFTDLSEQIEKKLKTSKWKLSLQDHYIDRAGEDGFIKTYDIEIKVNSEGKKYTISFEVEKYNDCYYIFVPVAYFSTF